MQQTTQIKKLLVIALLSAILLAALLSATSMAFAQPLDNDDFDVVFLETAKELYDTPSEELMLTANKELLLDIRLNPLGYVYDFVINGENGYATVILIDDVITVTEFALETRSPYENAKGNKVYVNYLYHLYETDGEFFTVTDNVKLTQQTVDALAEKAYKGSAITSSRTETITYKSKTPGAAKNLVFRHPAITTASNLTNACAPIAGANLIQYWDRLNENLIPNYTSYTKLGTNIVYKTENDTVQQVAVQLYRDMKTNSIGEGTTEDQFKSGFKTYCSRQGYNTVNYNSCMSNNKFSYNLAKQRLDAGQPLALFVDTFTIAKITEGNTDSIEYLVSNACHVMAGFGYKEISYVLTNGTTRNDYYIAVAGGFQEYGISFYNVNLDTQIDDVFGVVIS